MVDLQNFQADIALISETWFTKKHRTDELNINDYCLLRRDRSDGRKGGGVCAYVKSDYNCTIYNSASSNCNLDIEILWLSCCKSNCTYLIAICYHPPSPRYQPNDFILQLSLDIEFFINNCTFELMIIAGDFNNLNTDFLSDLFGLTQLVDRPTHCSNIIDKIFVSNPEAYTKCLVTKSLVKTKHMAVILTNSSNCRPTHTTNKAKQKCLVYDFRQPNIDYLRHTLGTYDWSVLYDINDIDETYSLFLRIVQMSISQCIPVKTVTIRNYDPYYITPLVKCLLVKRNRLRRRGKLDEANILASKINSVIAEERKQHLTSLTLANSKELWNAVKSCSGKDTPTANNSPLLTDPNTVNSFFATISTDSNYNASSILDLRYNVDVPSSDYIPFTDYEIEHYLRNLKNTSPGHDGIPSWVFKSCSFELASPVSYLINMSLSSGLTPSNWRISIITPIPKKNKPHSLSDYRPISVTPILSRLTEKLIVKKWIKPIILSDPTYLDQFGFKDTGSTTCALIKLFDYIVSSLDDRKCLHVDALLIDYSRAFDVVDHLLVLNKINSLNLPTFIKNWINSFLTDRSQRVKSNDLLSNELPINRGIVQGSALGPFLFTIMISDLKTLSPLNDLVKYADDSTLLVRSDSDVTIENENSNVKNWSAYNKLTINESKTKLISFSKNLSHGNGSAIGLPGIEIVKEASLLGILIDNDLSFSNHVSSILATCSQRFYLLKLLRDQGTPLSVLNSIYQSIIVNRVTYCISAWGGFIKETDVAKINSMLKRAKRYGFTDTLYDFNGLLKHSDLKLYHKMLSSSHCLHHVLPAIKTTNRPFRTCNSVFQHYFTLPITRTASYKKSFIPRILYNN